MRAGIPARWSSSQRRDTRTGARRFSRSAEGSRGPAREARDHDQSPSVRRRPRQRAGPHREPRRARPRHGGRRRGGRGRRRRRHGEPAAPAAPRRPGGGHVAGRPVQRRGLRPRDSRLRHDIRLGDTGSLRHRAGRAGPGRRGRGPGAGAPGPVVPAGQRGRLRHSGRRRRARQARDPGPGRRRPRRRPEGVRRDRPRGPPPRHAAGERRRRRPLRHRDTGGHIPRRHLRPGPGPGRAGRRRGAWHGAGRVGGALAAGRAVP